MRDFRIEPNTAIGAPALWELSNALQVTVFVTYQLYCS